MTAGGRVQGDLVAECLELVDEVAGLAVLVHQLATAADLSKPQAGCSWQRLRAGVELAELAALTWLAALTCRVSRGRSNAANPGPTEKKPLSSLL
jgi:hypothetical protein